MVVPFGVVLGYIFSLKKPAHLGISSPVATLIVNVSESLVGRIAVAVMYTLLVTCKPKRL